MEKERISDRAELTWLGQMGFLIRIGNTKLCIDYFASPDKDRLVKPPIDASKLTGIDAFLGTHDHMDHIDHEAWKIWARTNPDAVFIFPRKVISGVLADGVDEKKACGLNDSESIRIGDVTIHAIAASHEFLDYDEQSGLYPYLQYVIEGNGVRIHHGGDTLRYEGMLNKITSFGNIDAMILPINGRDAKRYRNNLIGNMTYQEAADLAYQAGCDRVIPGHFDMFEFNGEDVQLFYDYMDAKYRNKPECVIPRLMEKIYIE
ncbi:MAG: MBL fold metallo-hydrolase [Lachnospiraceae bacterium]|nr:MBL fold metallo-hydrolase [Lachnospiraceae bacterium]